MVAMPSSSMVTETRSKLVISGATLLTVTLVTCASIAPSLSITVAVTAFVGLGLSSRYWCVASNSRSLPVKAIVVVGEPSPQLISTVCVSSTPGSVKLPLSVTELPSSIMAKSKFTPVTVGATLFTVMSSGATASNVPSSSVAVAVIANDAGPSA